MQVTTMPFSITATHYQAKKRQKFFFLGNSHFEDLKHAATTYQKRHRYVNLRDWHSIAGTTTALKIVDHYSKKKHPFSTQILTVAHRGHATYIFISRDKNTVYRAIIYRAIN